MKLQERMYPPAAPVRPHRALLAFRRFMKNKEDTRLVFDFVYSVNGKTMRPAFKRWIESANGDLLFREDPQALLRAFDRREELRTYPVGTVGRIYADFMDRENLDTNGVAEANRAAGFMSDEFRAKYPEYAAFIWYMNLTHDMWHILTGYNRDSLGEAALLNYTCRHSGSRGVKYLALLASLRIKVEAPELPVFKVMANARKMGLESRDLVTADFIGMLERPLREVRDELNIKPDPVYAALPQERLLALVQPQAA